MARELPLLGSAVSGFMPPWLAAIFMVAASVWIVTLAVFLCGKRSQTDDDRIPKKKPTASTTAKASRPVSSGSTAVYGAPYVAGVAVGGCCGGGGCGGGGCGGGGGGCGGGGGGC